MGQLPFYSVAVVAGRIALAGVVVAVAICFHQLKLLGGVRLRALEAGAFVLAVVVGFVVPDLTVAALGVLAVLAAVVAPVALRSSAVGPR